MENKDFNFKTLLKIIFRVTKKNAYALSEHLDIDVSMISRWRTEKVIPNDEHNLPMIVDFVLKKSNQSQWIAMRNAIENLINEVSLAENLKRDILGQKTFGEFLLAALKTSVLPQIAKNSHPQDESEKEKKILITKEIIAGEILTNLACIDSRLELLQTNNFMDDEFSQKFQETRNSVAPAIEQIAKSGYNKLIILQTITSLRQAFSGLPIRLEFAQPLMNLELEGEINHENTRSFYDELANLQSKYESLFDWLITTANDKEDDEEITSCHKGIIKSSIDIIRNNSFILHMKGLSVLNDLKITSSNIDDKLKSLSCLKPCKMADEKEIALNYVKHLSEYEELIYIKSLLTQKLKNLRDKSLDTYRDINKQLIINPGDTWDKVVAKATSLRQLGRIGEAVAAFSRYGDMFGESDPTAKTYSRITQKFTVRAKSLGVEGGVYIFNVDQEGNGAKNGLKAGDIIIQYNEHGVNNMFDYINAEQSASSGVPIKLIYLRLNEEGEFYREITQIHSWPLGIEVMPV